MDRLAQWGIEVEKTCVLCKNDEETAEHLFLQCSVARTIWGGLFSWIGKQTDVPMIWEQFVQWCIIHGKGKRAEAQLCKIILAECIYGLWMERSSRIFEHKSRNEDQHVKEIAYTTIVRTPSRWKGNVSHLTVK